MLRRVLVAVVLAPVCTLACAQLLSWDDYSARPAFVPLADTRSDTATEAETDAPVPPARVPERPAGPTTPTGGSTLWVAAKHMYVGSRTALGVDSPEAWREWGFDLDHVCTSRDDSIANVGTCKRPPAALQEALTDGDRCRDNNFGQHVVPLVKLANAGFEKDLDTAVFEGVSSTWLLVIEDLGDGPDDAYAPGKLYFAAPTVAPPSWDGTDLRDVRSDSVDDRDLSKPKVVFDKAYVRDHVWISGVSNVVFPTPLTKHATAFLRLHSAVVTLALTPDHRSASRGVLAGAIPLATVEDLLLPVASSGGFCPGTSLYDSAYQSVMRFPDVVIDAPDLQDTTQTCDGISLGIGFDVAPVLPATTVVDPPPPKTGLCPDAGPG